MKTIVGKGLNKKMKPKGRFKFYNQINQYLMNVNIHLFEYVFLSLNL